MRLIEDSTTRNIYNRIVESSEETKRIRKIPIGLNDEKSKDVLNAVVGQLSDGMWENSPGMDRYWRFAGGLDDQGNLIVYDGYEGNSYNIAHGYNPRWYYSAFSNMDDEAVKRYFARKIKQIVKEEGLEWNRNNTEPCEYLNYNSGVTVRDAYKVYDRLLGRIDRITESDEQEPNFVMFYLNGKELGGHDLANEFEGERESARELFAYENNVKPEEIEVREVYKEDSNLNEATNNKDWEEICKAFCNKIGAELLFVNDDSFGYEDKNGQLVHMYSDELEEYLKNNPLKESTDNIIWTSEVTEDDYDKEELKANQYQDYLDSFDGTVKPDSYEEWLDSDWLYNYLYHEFNNEDNEYTEWYDFISNYDEEDLKRYYQDYLDDIKEREPDKPKDFDTWFNDYMIDDSSDQWTFREEDLKDSVLPMIDKQVNGAIFITGNYNSNYPDFKKSGPGGKIVKDGDGLVDWLSNEDQVKFTTEENNQIGVSAYDHDGSISGLLYTLPDDPHKILDIAMSTDYYDKNRYEDNNEIIYEFMYDLSNDNVSMRDIKKPELLVPIKNSFMITESEDSEEPTNNTRKFVVSYWRGNPQLANGGYYTSRVYEVENKKELNQYIKKAEDTAYGSMSKQEIVELKNNEDYSFDKETGKITVNKKDNKQINESKKPKDKKEKLDKRVVMQQGNVTCIKESENSYLVFENEADNETEHDTEESAMEDFMNRVGVDPNNELKEE